MFRKALISMMLAGFVIGAQAGEFDMELEHSEVFLGIQLSKAWTLGSHLRNSHYSSNGLGYGILVGAQNNLWRTLISVNLMNNNDVNYVRAELHVQFILPVPEMEYVALHPFIGLNAGYAKYKAKGGIDKGTATYGGEAGVVFDLSDNIDIDLTYQYSVGYADELDRINNLAIGINYKY